jgi:hypothetical protein
MPRTDFDLTNFTAGELSPRLKGRTDYQKYFNGAAGLQNFVVIPQGGITRRPGTALVALVGDQTNRPRLRRFQFSVLQAYMLEFGNFFVRVHKDDAQLVNDQAVTGAANNGAGLIRLTLASAAGLYTDNVMTVSGVLGTVEANSVWFITNVVASTAVTGAANNGGGEVRLTVTSTARFVDNSTLVVAGVGGTIEANGDWQAVIVDATHIDLPGSAFSNAWTAGGTVTGNDAFEVDLQGSAFANAYTSGGTTQTPVQVPTPYAAADLATLYFTQSDDTLFITHPNYPPATLTRSLDGAEVDWSYQTLVFRDGPYLDVNSTSTTLSVGASTFRGGQQVLKFGDAGLTLTLNPGVARSVLLTASSTFGINATRENVGQGFLSSDVGRHLRIKLLGSWAWTIIEEVLSPLEVVVTVQPTVQGGAYGGLDGAPWQQLTYYPVGVIVTNDGSTYQCVQAGYSGRVGGPMGSGSSSTTEIGDSTVVWNFITSTVPTSTTFWQLGKWTPGVNPFVCTFWQQRLMLLGTNDQPNAIEASVTGDFTNFAPTAQDGTTVDTNALSFVISDDQVNAITWVKAAGSAQAAQLAIGTPGEEQIMQAYSTAQPLTPTNVQVYSETTVGSAPIEPLRIGKSLLFVDRPGRKLIEWTFLWQVNGYQPVELTEPSEHITQSGVVQMVYAQAPHRLVCLLLEDGTLVFASYNKDQQVFAPTRQVLGGNYQGGPPIVESLDVIPSSDGSYDEIWLAVLRTVDGADVRTIEVLTRWFENATVPQENAVFLDCSLSLTLPAPAATLTITGLVNTQTSVDLPPAWTGNVVLTSSVDDIFPAAPAGQIVRVNGGVIQITSAVLGSSTQVNGTVTRALATTGAAAAGAWTLAPLQTTVSGLDYLNGETVGILGDGADLGTAVVTGGSIAMPAMAATVMLPAPGASMVTVGLPYASAYLGMPYEPQRAAAAVTQGKAKRIDTMWVRFFESLGCNFGQRLTDPLTFQTRDKLEALETRSASMPMGQAPTLFSGSRRLKPQGGYDQEGQMLITTSSPLPLTVLSIYASADVGDMPRPGQ